MTKPYILEECGPEPPRLASHRTLVYSAVKLYLSVYARGRAKKFHGEGERWRRGFPLPT